MVLLQCSGWWEQDGYGRQPMHELELSFSDGNIAGTGLDIIGAFRFEGHLNEDRIYLLKQYVGKHQIEYHGVSMGEGAYSGVWSCYGYPGGRWFICVRRQISAAAERAMEFAEPFATPPASEPPLNAPKPPE